MASTVYRVPFNDPNAQPSASLADGIPVFATWNAAFDADPLGDRGWLDFPFQDTALIFQYQNLTDDAWVLLRDEETACDSGVGDTDASTGFSDAQNETDTSLFPGGYESTVAYYTITDLGIRPSGLPYSATATAATTSATVPHTGTVRNDCVGIAGLLVQSALEGSDIIFMENGRTCEVLLGPPEFHPAGQGLYSLDNVINGEASGCGIRNKLKRNFVIPPGTVTQIGFIFKMRHQRKINVPADPSFAAPTADSLSASICVLKCKWTFGGYFSDENAIPLVQLGEEPDFAEKRAADKAAY